MRRRKQMMDELDGDIREHIARETEDNIARGMAPDDAHAAAMRKFGNVARVKEAARDVWIAPWLDQLWQDVKFGARIFRKSRGFTIVAVLTLALGIGANTAIFSVVYPVLFRALPYPAPSQLVSPRLEYRNSPATPHISYFAWRDRNRVFSGVGAYFSSSNTLTGVGEAEDVTSVCISATLLPVLGIEPSLGRNFRRDEEAAGQVVILSHKLWAARFGSDPGVLGRVITLDDKSYTVIGVMPASFRFPGSEPDLFLPLGLSQGTAYTRFVNVIARLKPGVSIAQAFANLSVINPGMPKATPAFLSSLKLRLVPLHDELVGSVRPELLALLGAVGFVLLIACSNVANLQLARASSRQREITVRSVLGAGRTRLVRQLLTESALLGALGGVTGVLLAYWGVASLRALIPEGIVRTGDIHMDLAVLIYAMAISLVAGVLSGLAPVAALRRLALHESLKEGGAQASAGRERHLLRNLLMTAEIAAALVLLTSAGLLLKSFVRMNEVNLGFEPRNVLAANLILSRTRYPQPEQRTEFFAQLLDRLRALPGVRAAAISSAEPGWTSTDTPLSIEGRTQSPADAAAYIPVDEASPDYFRAVGVPLLAGRAFGDTDTAGATDVAIVSEAFARHYFPGGESPLGHRIVLHPRGQDTLALLIVGVVGDVQLYGAAPPEPRFYRPFDQNPQGGAFIALQTTADPKALAPAVRQVVAAINANQPVSIFTLEQNLSEMIAGPRFNTAMVGLFAIVALVLASVGIFGVVGYSVTQRTREIGVRMALGAERRDVLRLIVGRGMVWVLAGVACGAAGALALTHYLRTLLYQTHPNDPWTFALSAIVLSAVALAACYIPARRAMRVDPVSALRCE